MSLLEVLVALGILAAGLASVATLLPAAGARLADATAIDRAGALAANTQADVRIRGVLNASMFSGSATRAAVAGPMFSTIASSSSQFVEVNTLYPTISITQDDLQMGGSGTTIEVKDTGVCCGVTVIPMASATASITPGTPARVSVATFKKSSVQSQPITLTAASGSAGVLSGTNVAIFTTGSDAAADSTRKQYLGGCAWVLAFTASGTARPAWLQIGASWTTTNASGQPTGSYVSFTDPAAVAPLLTGNTLTVHGFTNILRVDERPATLR